MSMFLEIGRIEDIPRQAARLVKTDMGCIAIFRTFDDKIFALDDKCPHKGGPISNGIQHGDMVTCPLHNWVFDLNTGQAQGADSGVIRTYPVEVREGVILIARSSLDQAVAAE